MSNQSGITASEKLNNFLSKCRDGRYRLIKICISSSGGQPQLELEVRIQYDFFCIDLKSVQFTLGLAIRIRKRNNPLIYRPESAIRGLIRYLGWILRKNPNPPKNSVDCQPQFSYNCRC